MLKSKNQPFLWAFIIANALALVWIYFRINVDIEQLTSASKRGSSISLALITPVIVVALNALLSASQKAVLVFWRLQHALPGHRAFTEIGPRDSRVDMSSLAAKLGALPNAPREQNVVWYRLFKKHEANPVIAESHRLYLLMRDLATLALLFAAVALALSPLSRAWTDAGVYVAALLVGYLILRIAAMRHGNGLVSNVLAVESTGKVIRRKAKNAPRD